MQTVQNKEEIQMGTEQPGTVPGPTVCEEIQSLLLRSILIQSYPQNTEDVELCLVNIDHIFDHLASLSNLKCKTIQQKKMNRERWFDSDCKTIRKTLRKVSNLKHRNPDSQEDHLIYCGTQHNIKTLRTKK